MSRRPKIVEDAECILEQFITEWQKEPYRWYTESDFQAELAVRLSKYFRLRGIGYILGNYEDAELGFKGKQYWSIVTCEPTIYYKYKDGSLSECRPDIVIWDSNVDSDDPPDREKGNWPIVWACEIKSGNRYNNLWDLEKLRYLVSQHFIYYGCSLKISPIRASRGNGISWKDDEKEPEKITVCNAMLPHYIEKSGT